MSKVPKKAKDSLPKFCANRDYVRSTSHSTIYKDSDNVGNNKLKIHNPSMYKGVVLQLSKTVITTDPSVYHV